MPVLIRVNGRERRVGTATAIEIPDPDVTRGDMIYMGQRQRTLILRKTERGVDVDKRAFERYSSKGPYYWNPGRATGSRNRVRSARAMAKRLGLTATAASLGRRSTPFGGVTPGGSIKYRNYGEFKRSLGRGNVDLRGPRAPHMLQQLVVRAPGTEIRGNRPLPRVNEQTQRGHSASVGIYGGEAARAAAGHQTGTKTLPRRRFVGVTRQELAAHAQMLLKRVVTRVRREFREQ